MRKLTFLRTPVDNKLKLILHDAEDGTFLYCYDRFQDTSCVSDLFFSTLAEAEEFCADTYSVEKDDWILLPETIEGCQDDFILPTRVKGRVTGNPMWGQYEILENGQWGDKHPDHKVVSFRGMAVNERLFTSGLMPEFGSAKATDRPKARKLLAALGVDHSSISKIVD